MKSTEIYCNAKILHCSVFQHGVCHTGGSRPVSNGLRKPVRFSQERRKYCFREPNLKFFRGSMPPEPTRSSRLRRSQIWKPIRFSPGSAPVTGVYWFKLFCTNYSTRRMHPISRKRISELGMKPSLNTSEVTIGMYCTYSI